MKTGEKKQGEASIASEKVHDFGPSVKGIKSQVKSGEKSNYVELTGLIKIDGVEVTIVGNCTITPKPYSTPQKDKKSGLPIYRFMVDKITADISHQHIAWEPHEQYMMCLEGGEGVEFYTVDPIDTEKTKRGTIIVGGGGI